VTDNLQGPTTSEPEAGRHSWVVPPASRWIYIAPALGALLFVGHAWEDAGLVGAVPYALAFLLSFASILRPTRIAWIVLAILYGTYLVLLMSAVTQVQFGEWFAFFLAGAIPCAALWWGRPRRARVSS
jgi:hypothetical protein